MCNSGWNDLDLYSNAPLDYEDRTLYSTWNLSFTQVQAQDPAAAELLRLIAYLDNQDLWYELFQAGAEGQPLWWSEVVKSKARFNYAMSKLHDYSLVEIRAGSYSLHTCVHDWTLEYLNRGFNDELWAGHSLYCSECQVGYGSRVLGGEPSITSARPAT